ncbi:MAG: outer membrane protein [Rhodovulum sp.]
MRCDCRSACLIMGLAVSAGAATAGGYTPPPAEQPAVAAAPAVGAFDGFYLGLSAGAVSADGTQRVGSISGPIDLGDSAAFGLLAGYNAQRDRLVYGVELGYSAFDQLRGNNIESDGVTDLRGRIGYVWGDLLVYGAVGWSWSTIESATTSADGDLDGANYGIGIEYNVNERFFLGADYTMRDLDGAYASTVDTDLDMDTLSLRVGFRF